MTSKTEEATSTSHLKSAYQPVYIQPGKYIKGTPHSLLSYMCVFECVFVCVRPPSVRLRLCLRASAFVCVSVIHLYKYMYINICVCLSVCTHILSHQTTTQRAASYFSTAVQSASNTNICYVLQCRCMRALYNSVIHPATLRILT